MPKIPNKSFQQTQKLFATPHRPCSKQLALSKLAFDGTIPLKNLKKYHSRTDLSMVTDFSYKRLHGRFRDSHLIKILKKAKNLKKLTMNLGHASEKLKFHFLFKAISQLKLKSLTLVYRQSGPGHSSANFVYDLMILLKRTNTIEALNLEFENMSFPETLNKMPQSFYFHNIARLGLSFAAIPSNIDKWLMYFGKAVGKTQYKNRAAPKIMYLEISKNSCPELSPMGISRYLTNFDKVHLTNHVNLKILKGYNQEEDFYGYGYGNLLNMFLYKKKGKFKLNTLEICSESLCHDFSAFTEMNYNMPISNLHLEIKDNWDTKMIRENLQVLNFLKPTKGVFVRFPQRVRPEEEEDNDFDPYDDDPDNPYPYDDENPYDDDPPVDDSDDDDDGTADDQSEGKDEDDDKKDDNSSKESEEDNGLLLDHVLPFLLAKATKNITLCLDFSRSIFDESDYMFLETVLAEVHQPISCLNLILPGPSLGNGGSASFSEGQIVPAIMRTVCTMYNITTCTVNINKLELKYYNGISEKIDSFQINEKSSLEKLILRMNKCSLKPKILVNIFKVFSRLPKLNGIEVVCSPAVFQACKAIKSIKSRATGKPITLCFIPEKS